MDQDKLHGEIITVSVNELFLVIIFVKTKPQVDKFLQSMCLYNFRLFRALRKLNFCSLQRIIRIEKKDTFTYSVALVV